MTKDYIDVYNLWIEKGETIRVPYRSEWQKSHKIA